MEVPCLLKLMSPGRCSMDFQGTGTMVEMERWNG